MEIGNNNTIMKNNFTRTHVGIFLAASSYNNVSENFFNDGYGYGIYLYMTANNNTIYKNNFINLRDYAIYNPKISSLSGESNLFYLNYFINNNKPTKQALDDGKYNKWDDGSIGNYWSDYTGCDKNGDGIGETPYTVLGDAGAKDYKPITEKRCAPPIEGDDDDDDNGDPPSISFGFLWVFPAICSIIILVYYRKSKNKISREV